MQNPAEITSGTWTIIFAADLARAAWAAVATRSTETLAASAMFAWLREQNVTD